jgi:hypothetical protein
MNKGILKVSDDSYHTIILLDFISLPRVLFEIKVEISSTKGPYGVGFLRMLT